MYQIVDEPQPSSLEKYVVSPIWPLFAFMFAGSWLAFPWFIFNSVAMGSSQLRKNIALVAATFFGTLFIAFGLLHLEQMKIINEANIRYAILIFLAWKLGFGYMLYIIQSRTHQLFEEFGGQTKSGLIVVVAGAFFGRKLVLGLFSGDIWKILVS
ncbi:MAG: hypothetical protein GY765_43260 [bacterium]|nr:hypothetical protein [bacterium]